MTEDRKTNRIVIVGAGGFGREIASWYLDSLGCNQNIAFLDDIKKGVVRIGSYQFPVISDLNTFDNSKKDKLLMGLANPHFKREIADKFRARGISFSTFIHKSVICSPGADIGEGSIICPYSVISDNVKLGRFSTINLCCTIGHDVSIDDFNTLSSHVDITGGCQIGKLVFWGSGSRIIPNKCVADGCKIGAGSLVTHNISTMKTVYCQPSKTL